MSVPDIKHAVINRPKSAITMLSFDKRLYTAKQLTKSKLYKNRIEDAFSLPHLSAKTIVYKALTQSYALEEFYLDLKIKYVTRFCFSIGVLAQTQLLHGIKLNHFRLDWAQW